jgi:histidyl-tRNA synthetase
MYRVAYRSLLSNFMPKFQRPTGTHDIFSEDLAYFQKIEKTAGQLADFYDFQRIETPILENTELFEKGTGSDTDIVQKEMFSLRTKGNDHLTLRPEGTPPLIRAYLEKGMQNQPKPVRLWYYGPYFRYERPQADRFRQFHQFGFEFIGMDKPIIDAQVIQIFYNILRDLGLKKLVVAINSIGDKECRQPYKKKLVKYLKAHQSGLCPDCKRRLRENPLRVLDCKQEHCREIISQAPQMVDNLCKECHDHFTKVLEFLDELEIPYRLDPYLVRGLDYYTKTVFEIFPVFEKDELDQEEGETITALGGGGRYDRLVRLLGGPETPACGFAAGIERIVKLMKKKGRPALKKKQPEIFLAQIGEMPRKRSLKLLEEFRKKKIKVSAAPYKDSLSFQLKIADRLKVKLVLILGQNEIMQNKIIIREMETGKQQIVSLDNVFKEVKKKL